MWFLHLIIALTLWSLVPKKNGFGGINNRTLGKKKRTLDQTNRWRAKFLTGWAAGYRQTTMHETVKKKKKVKYKTGQGWWTGGRTSHRPL